MSPTRTTLLPAIGFVLGAGLVNVTALADDDPPDSITLTGIIRDFREHTDPNGHPDFEDAPDEGPGNYIGNIAHRRI